MPHDRVEGSVTVIRNASVDAVAPAGSIWSSVHDMAKWMRFLLAGGVTPDGARLLDSATVAELFTPQMIVSPSRPRPSSWPDDANRTTASRASMVYHPGVFFIIGKSSLRSTIVTERTQSAGSVSARAQGLLLMTNGDGILFASSSCCIMCLTAVGSVMIRDR